jgi:hypothetical protein
MDQVNTVALWAGLIASIAGIVLSAVATWFAFRVNDQATAINNQMIKSLERIEASVERVSSDTRELITAGWNKMLGSMGSQINPGPTSQENADAIVNGVATEIESELNEDGGEEPEAKIQRLEEALRELQATVSNLRRGTSHATPMIHDALLQTVRDLPIEGRALLSILIRGGHLTRHQYQAAMKRSELRLAVRSLRNSGLLVPLEGFENDQKVPVYWLPSGLIRVAKVSLNLAGDAPRDIVESVSRALETIGYKSL